MYLDQMIYVGKSGDKKVCLNPKMANRHGMIAGATGTGKTVTLKVLAESFSNAGVPVFLADVKGDLAGMCQNGEMTENMQERIARFGLEECGFKMQTFPTEFWDIYQENGLPLRTTVSEMGPLLMSRILELNDVQSAVLKVVYKIADDMELLLVDTKDLRSMLAYVSENAKELALNYGNMSNQTLATIVRAIISLEEEGGEMFFGETALNLGDWIKTDCDGHGTIQVLDCQKLILNPTMYSTFMLWLLSELYEGLPEVGDAAKPKMVFFFDEAHLLFDNASKNLLDKIEQVVKLIRSKGVGIFFITQNPQDIPNGVLAQLGNKIQHALHAYTPAEQKAVKAAAMSYRENPEFNTYDELLNLGTGEALVSFLGEDGVPSVVEKVKILPPQSRMGVITEGERTSQVNGSLLYSKYTEYFDRDSAFEFFERAKQAAQEAAIAEQIRLQEEKEQEEARKLAEKQAAEEEKQRLKEEEAARKQAEKEELAAKKAAEKEELAAQKAAEKEALAAQKAAEKEALAAQKAAEKEALAAQKAAEKAELAAQKQAEKEALAAQKAEEKAKEQKTKAVKRVAKNVASSTGSTIGREVGKAVGSSVGGDFGKKLGGSMGSSLGRGILGSLFWS